MLVIISNPAITNSMIPNVPASTFVKYKIAIITAMITLIILSKVPMFFFIFSPRCFKVAFKLLQIISNMIR